MAGETMHFAHEVFSIEKLLANADDATLEYMFSQPHDEVGPNFVKNSLPE